jgi:hopanoid C-2 methylase
MSRSYKIPMPIGPPLLAGAFSPEFCDIKIYNELYGGPLEDPALLAWPDMIVMTGLSTSLDRMRHITAYARTKNPRVISVAGGHAVRSVPRYCRRFFDYCCLGDVEQLREVIAEAFGPEYAAEEMTPRFDLATYLKALGYLETSRYCNFRCTFCTLTGEGRQYSGHDLDYIRRQIVALGKRRTVTLLDNNFFGNDRKNWLARLEVVAEGWRAGYYSGWGALVTNDFFYEPENVRLAKQAGCIALFSGVETFDPEWLRRNGKLQNTRAPQVETIRSTLDAGIVFLYGMMMDVVTRPLSELRRELEFIVATHEIPLPSYVCVPAPILGTPLFYDCLRKDIILPNTRVRDLDGTTLSLRPHDGMEEVVDFIRDLQSLRGHMAGVVRHSIGFTRRYRSILTPYQITIALANAAMICTPVLASLPTTLKDWRRRRTHVSSTEPLDAQYTPAWPVDSRFESWFRPTMLTDADGRLSEEIAEDVLADRPATPSTGYLVPAPRAAAASASS